MKQDESKTLSVEEVQISRRKLSIWRVIFAVLLITGITTGTIYGYEWWKSEQPISVSAPWFAPYVDITSKPTYAFEQSGPTETSNSVLSFIVSSHVDPCTPSWGGYYTMDESANILDLDRRIARLRQLNGQVVVSFGGALNDELALNCTDSDKLLIAYESVIERYSLDTIDLDLENKSLSDKDSSERRASVIASLQKKQHEEGKNLAVWLTLPVAPQGLTQDGTDAITQMLSKGVDLAGINIMTMDYGESRAKDLSMLDASKNAMIATHRQLGILYKQAGIELNSVSLWRKIGVTPMIGQNDIRSEIFTLDDARDFNQFLREKGIGRVSMWSANRDIPCGENYIDLKVVSDSCSGVKADKFSFSKALSGGFGGSISDNSSLITSNDTDIPKVEDDNPDNSPYQIWVETGAYLEGVKVVWHGNVYESKWWTKGDIPDNPVLQSWETPWQLLGPVLPGEKPIKQITLPAGTYPEWSGTIQYESGDRVLFDGIAFQSKWWNIAQSPAAAASNADSSPWNPLPLKEIIKVTDELNSKKSNNKNEVKQILQKN